MTGDDDAVGGEIKAPIALVVGRVAEERTQGGTWGEFV
jgi:hypothetical protein